MIFMFVRSKIHDCDPFDVCRDTLSRAGAGPGGGGGAHAQNRYNLTKKQTRLTRRGERGVIRQSLSTALGWGEGASHLRLVTGSLNVDVQDTCQNACYTTVPYRTHAYNTHGPGRARISRRGAGAALDQTPLLPHLHRQEGTAWAGTAAPLGAPRRPERRRGRSTARGAEPQPPAMGPRRA